MKREISRVLFGKDIQRFKDLYPDYQLHKILNQSTVYVAGEYDQYVIITSDEWESRFLEVGEYKDNEEI